MEKILSKIVLIMLIIGLIIPIWSPVVSRAITGKTDSRFEYTVNPDEKSIKITRYVGTDTEVVIPSSIDGYSVTDIGRFAFFECSSLTNLKIPDTVSCIREYAFKGCSSLTSVEIPKKVKIIERETFYGCSSLTSIEIPAGLAVIESEAFYGCSSLIDIEIPAGVWDIHNTSFKGCSSLTNIGVNENNKNFTSVDGVLYSKDKTELICYPAGKTQQQYNVLVGVTSIYPYAFYGCNNLTNIKIPAEVSMVNFKDCSSLTSIEVNENNENYTSVDGVLYSKDKSKIICYPAGKTQQQYNILEGVICIGMGSFYKCNNLTNIEIPTGVKSIEQDAFYKCSNITITCERDSVAHKYAVRNKIKYKLIGENETITSTDYTIDETSNLVTNIKPNTSIEEIKSKLITNEEYEILTKSGQVVKDEKIGTGMKIKFKTGKVYEIVVRGDANGDGKMSTTDITKLKKHIIKQENLEGCYGKAVDINNDGKTSVTDLAKMKRVLVGLDTL